MGHPETAGAEDQQADRDQPAGIDGRGLRSGQRAPAMTGRVDRMAGEFPDYENVSGADAPASLTFLLS